MNILLAILIPTTLYAYFLLGICTPQIVVQNKSLKNIFLTGLKKKIKQFEELFEQENGYKVRKKCSGKNLSAWLTYFCLDVIIDIYRMMLCLRVT